MKYLVHSFAFLSIAGAAVGAACSSSPDPSSSGNLGAGGAGASMSTSSGSSQGGGGEGGTVFAGTGGGSAWTGFPVDPVVEEGAPQNAKDLFDAAGAGNPSGGPCLVEPEPGTLFPRNWLRPRFRFVPAAGQNLFEIRLHIAGEPNDLVVYTKDPSWTMPADMWLGLAADVIDKPIDVSIRGGAFDGTSLTDVSVGASGPFTIAPTEAAGSIVYWTTSGGSALKGFKVGDESVIEALAPGQVQMNTVSDADVTCVGCHTSTPDGKMVAFTAQGPWGNALASIEEMSVGAEPSFLGQGARATLQQFGETGISTFSGAHWKPGDRIMVSGLGKFTASQLTWFDLEATGFGEGVSYGYIKREGDPRGVGAPAWSHDGNTIVYVSTDAQTTGRLDKGYADLFFVPYANKAGGVAAPMPGASAPALSEYYPAFSPDDRLLAFNRIPGTDNMYDAPNAEVFVIPAKGGEPVRIDANDPPACSGKASPGVTNSWPKWAPEAKTVNGKTYYWLIFSSKRGGAGNPQLYVTGVVAEGDKLTTYPALYLWNQPEAENNHTPAWDVFDIPPVPPPN
ncbi:TolB family protein [Polyangium aurulentum]|uniref:TolB family protein n=1 Tax=Polyangium aurulentum TaxID=2567896 RepID=UPI0010AE01AF|nr:PD40 domain-containing protein [Polyangium aurulentum]UQA58911.1 PD40 domain-containing protein [Polyangium aurulentum]